MPPPPVNVTLLRRAFVDICQGYSVGKHEGRALYVRHLSHSSHIAFEDIQTRFEEEAVSKGAPREAARLEALRAGGQWSDAKEADIARQRDTIVRFEETKRTVAIPSMLEQYDRQIAEEKAKLGRMLIERAELIRLTAELYAQQRLNDHYIITNVFADKELTKPFLPADAFEDLADSEVETLLTAYHTAIEPCSDPNLRRLAVQDFFTSYYALAADNAGAFYGRPVCELTYYQIRLASIARYFKALMEQVDLNRLDPAARTDPDALEKAYTVQKNAAEALKEGKIPAGGMTNADIKAMGLEGQIAHVTENLSGAELVARLARGRKG